MFRLYSQGIFLTQKYWALMLSMENKYNKIANKYIVYITVFIVIINIYTWFIITAVEFQVFITTSNLSSRFKNGLHNLLGICKSIPGCHDTEMQSSVDKNHEKLH